MRSTFRPPGPPISTCPIDDLRRTDVVQQPDHRTGLTLNDCHKENTIAKVAMRLRLNSRYARNISHAVNGLSDVCVGAGVGEHGCRFWGRLSKTAGERAMDLFAQRRR